MTLIAQIPSLPRIAPPTSRDDELKAPTAACRLLHVRSGLFVMIDGSGPPAGGNFAARMAGPYATAHTLRLGLKRRGIGEKIGPLEALWDIRPNQWRWTQLIRLPDQATAAELATALEVGRSKLAPEIADDLRIEHFAQGLCVQVMHVGPYSAQQPTIERLHAAIAAAGLKVRGRQHEIYVGDPRWSARERLQTIIRQRVE
jgi:hypothetical protein